MCAPRSKDTFRLYFWGDLSKMGGMLVMPYCDAHVMNEHLAEILRHVAHNAHAVFILDQTGWHQTDKLELPDNITLISLPPKSPKLNRVENIWQSMCDDWLLNRIFQTYNDIVDHCCKA